MMNAKKANMLINIYVVGGIIIFVLPLTLSIVDIFIHASDIIKLILKKYSKSLNLNGGGAGIYVIILLIYNILFVFLTIRLKNKTKLLWLILFVPVFLWGVLSWIAVSAMQGFKF